MTASPRAVTISGIRAPLAGISRLKAGKLVSSELTVNHPTLSGILNIALKSKHVKINPKKIKPFAETVNAPEMGHWMRESPFDLSALGKDQKLGFVFVFNSLSFSYWGSPKWTVGYNGKLYDGTWAMIVSLGKAINDGVPITDPKYLRGIGRGELDKILRGNVRIPLFEERLNILREIGDVTTRKFGGKFSNIIQKADGDALRLLDLILDSYPSFQDSGVYAGSPVHFNKRAQLLVSDANQIIESEGGKGLANLNKLTACADYKLPKVLNEQGILEYSANLEKMIEAGNEIPHGSEEEIEIRANTILAVEMIREQLKGGNSDVSSMAVNDYLWCASQQPNPEGRQYHRTRTTAY